MNLCTASAKHQQTMKPMPRHRLGIFRKVYPRRSETFISEPAKQMARYDPTFITCNLLRSNDTDSTISIGQDQHLGLKQALYLITRSPRFFKDQAALSKLDLLHSHFGPDGIYAMKLAEQLGIPFLVTFHGWDITINRSRPWNLKSPFYLQLLWHESKLKAKASAFIAVSKFIQMKLFQEGYPTEKVIQHYIGVDTSRFSVSHSKSSSRYILCVGRHTEKKGIDTLLKAFARIAHHYPDVSLVQVGSGHQEKQLKRLVETLGIRNQVHFLGACSHEKVCQLMQEAEIFALPSQTARNGDSEALGIVFNEASASGKPIVSTLHGGIPEVVRNGETGYLVHERDDEALADRLDFLLSNPKIGREMGRQGRIFTCTHFDLKTQTAKLEDIYDAIIAG